jgi:hypothetical protein
VADLKLTIGIQDSVVNGESLIGLLLENVGGQNLLLRLISRLELRGSLEGWSLIDIRSHDAIVPLMDNIAVALAPGQNIYSRIRLGGLLFSLGLGSSAPNLPWDEFSATRSPVNVDLSIQAICDYEENGTPGQIASNVVERRLGDVSSEQSLGQIRRNIAELNLSVQALMSAVDDLSRAVAPPGSPPP